MTNETILSGGVVRISHGQAAAEAAPQVPREATRVYSGTTRFSFGDDEAQATSGVTRFAHSTAGTTGGSVAATLDRAGHRSTVELVPGVPSSRTDVAVALREGLLVRNAAGDLVDPQDAQQRADGLVPPAQVQDQPVDRGAGVFDAGEDADWAADIEPLPQNSYDAAVASVVAVAAHGVGSLEDTAKALAANAGIDPELAGEYVQEGVAMYERAVARALAPMGLEGDRLQEAYEYMRARPGELQDAIQKLVHARDPSGFKNLAKDFRVANPGDLTMYKQAGLETRVDRDTGDLMVRHGQGGWQRAADLAKASAPVAVNPQRPARQAPTQARRTYIDPVTGDSMTEAEYTQATTFRR